MNATATPAPTLPAEFNLDSVITWKTAKTPTGYSFKVFSVMYQTPSLTLFAREGLASREMAAYRAKAWVRYFKALQRNAKG